MELVCDCPLEGKEFLFVGMTPLLGVIHNPTRISDRMIASIHLLLRENSPEAFTRCVRLKEERFIEVGKSQNGGLKTGHLEAFKSLKSFSREVHWLSLFVLILAAGQVIQGGRYFGEALDEMPVVTDQANERFHLRVRVRRRTLGDGLQILF